VGVGGKTTRPERRPDVLIVGAGPVGLSLACELGLYGIPCVVAEKRDGTVNVPKMSMVSARNMEFCRRWGIAKAVRQAVWPESHAFDIVYVNGLRGRELARLAVPSYQQRGKLDYTPEGACHCPQIYFDPILARHAAALPTVDLRYGTRLDSFEQDDDGVTATLTAVDTGEVGRLRTSFLVGCDGAMGTVRSALNIELGGKGALAISSSIFFRSKTLATFHDKGWARIYRLIDETGCWAELIPIDGVELWRLTLFHDADVSDPQSVLAHMAGGKFEAEILSVMRWERRDFVASNYGFGRVFLAGDSAHQCSPTYGLGMHTGLEEAVNLAWKLAAVREGWGGPHLLSSYEAERRPIALRNVALSTRSFEDITAIPGWCEDSGVAQLPGWQRNLERLGGGEMMKMRYAYEASPICVYGNGDDAQLDNLFAARVGARAPHAWLSDRRSTLDLFGRGFVLLVLQQQPGDREKERKLLATAAACGLPLRIVDVPDAEIASIYRHRLVLVRPDGHIAWGDDDWPDRPEVLLDQVRGAVPVSRRLGRLPSANSRA
jgi:2-polyprenyl-6-methoxyphenol hydroxylase-like FAD-dependent oxidoreductase